jgi:hypothetical protein
VRELVPLAPAALPPGAVERDRVALGQLKGPLERARGGTRPRRREEGRARAARHGSERTRIVRHLSALVAQLTTRALYTMEEERKQKTKIHKRLAEIPRERPRPLRRPRAPRAPAPRIPIPAARPRSRFPAPNLGRGRTGQKPYPRAHASRGEAWAWVLRGTEELPQNDLFVGLCIPKRQPFGAHGA